MIPSQQAMMLDAALAFERLVKHPKVGASEAKGKISVTWDKPAEVTNYINKLQTAAERMSTDNRKLRKRHIAMTGKVVDCVFLFL